MFKSLSLTSSDKLVWMVPSLRLTSMLGFLLIRQLRKLQNKSHITDYFSLKAENR